MRPKKKGARERVNAPEPEHVKKLLPDTSLASQTPQQIAQRLEEDFERFEKTLTQFERLPVFTGRPGRLTLDVLDRIDKFRDSYRQKARDYLVEHPGSIPHWYAETQSRRSLSRDTMAVYDAVKDVIPDLSVIDFLGACSASISGLTKLLEARGLSADEIYERLDQALGEGLLSHEVMVSLRRDKEGK